MKSGCSCCGGNLPQSLDREKKTECKEPIRVGTKLSVGSRLASLLVRLAFRRSSFSVEPALYSVGNPDCNSPVFVTASYSLSFDKLRSSLSGMDAYILTLDTRGINVWCAAGKGTFGTEELVRMIRLSGLENLVSHRQVILPQLGAPGVEAHRVRELSGFRVIYGPVRAQDIPEFIRNDKVAAPGMRIVSFNVKDRLVLTGVELVQGLKYGLLAIPILLVLGLIRDKAIDYRILLDALPFFGAVFAGGFAVPVLLPWIPGRSFAFKGWIAGILLAAIVSILQGASLFLFCANLLLLPALSAFIALDFTGATTFTSLSGVVKEMRIGMPFIVVSFCAGLLMTVVGFFRIGGIS